MSKLDWLTQEINGLKDAGLYNRIRTIGSAQGARLVVEEPGASPLAWRGGALSKEILASLETVP